VTLYQNAMEQMMKTVKILSRDEVSAYHESAKQQAVAFLKEGRRIKLKQIENRQSEQLLSDIQVKYTYYSNSYDNIRNMHELQIREAQEKQRREEELRRLQLENQEKIRLANEKQAREAAAAAVKRTQDEQRQKQLLLEQEKENQRLRDQIARIPSGPRALGVIDLKSGQHATYIVHKDFDYFVQMAAGSSVTMKSKHGGNITIKRNIWGPGTLSIACSVTLAASFGVAPSPEEYQGLPCYTYTGTTFEEEIP